MVNYEEAYKSLKRQFAAARDHHSTVLRGVQELEKRHAVLKQDLSLAVAALEEYADTDHWYDETEWTRNGGEPGHEMAETVLVILGRKFDG